MKKDFSIWLILALSMPYGMQSYTPQQAVINCPVADLVGEPLNSEKKYAKMPLFSDKNGFRIHQALFNEVVLITDENPTEYRIEIGNAYFITPTNNKPQNTYWVLKQHCTVIGNAIKHCIPAPILYKNVNQSFKNGTIVLTQPWHSKKAHMTFSAGTRFVGIPDASDNQFYAVKLFDHKKNRCIKERIPHSHSIQERKEPHSRTFLIQVIRSWIEANSKTCIPYTWGGCSYIHRYGGNYKEKHQKNTGNLYSYPKTHHTPHTGFDCAGLILRAAQIACMPFFCKNSYTISTKLKPITRCDEIEVGDVLWIPGHVMLIADLENNTLIEARGYPHGYGKLHEISISEQFKGINTIAQLFNNYRSKKPLIRLNKKETVVTTIPSYKILKLY